LLLSAPDPLGSAKSRIRQTTLWDRGERGLVHLALLLFSGVAAGPLCSKLLCMLAKTACRDQSWLACSNTSKASLVT
ncbi:Hypothetical predicted protein, partial [Pelobates cultripes]